MLNLLRPHVARSYRHVERRTLMARALHPAEPAARDVRVTSILLDAEDRPVHFGLEALRWMEAFFP